MEKTNTAVENNTPWGLHSCIDMHDCDPARVRDAEFIKKFVAELCDLIDMKPFGETQIVNFGEDERVAGFSMTQLIETSLISAHFVNLTNAIYLDIFSCKMYDTKKAEEFAVKSFKAGSHRLMVLERR